jgi:hypothetical protein
MGRVIRPLLVGALLLGAAVTGVALAASLGATFAAGTLGLGIAKAVGASIIIGSGLSALQGAMSYFQPRQRLAPFDPRAVNPDPSTTRKMVFGRTVFPVDLLYTEPSGNDQEFVDYIVALAAHRSDGIEELYFDNDLAWTAAGGAQGKYAGYLTVEVILEAGAAAFHTVNAGVTWGSSTRLTGCTTMRVRVKRSDNSRNSQSPFGSGISGRWAVVGRGVPVYDPRLDSTVPGGSGSQRANDQSTWAYTVGGVANGANPALQLLAYLLGWRINGVVSVGCGIAPDILDMPSFAASAAICNEAVALAAGGTQRRYEAGLAVADSDEPLAVMKALLDAMNGELVDDGGRLALRLAVNDLATPVATFTDADFVGPFEWQPQPPISEQFTVVRGRFTQPDMPALFGPVTYPDVAIPRLSQVPRALPIDLIAVQEPRRAHRIATQIARRQLYRGEFVVTLGIRGWQLQRNDVVTISSTSRGWVAKLFRVRFIRYNMDGGADVLLREENAAIYGWTTADETTPIAPVAPVVFDSRFAASWLMAAIEPGADVTPDELPAAPRGNWAAGIAYRRGDIVQFLVNTYVAKTDHTSATANQPPNAGFWELWSPASDGAVAAPAGGAGATTGSTSYSTIPAAGPVSCRAGPSGEIIISHAYFAFADGNNTDSYGAAAKWQRDIAGTWTDVASETSVFGIAPGGSASFGAGLSLTITGLTPGSLHDVRLLARRLGAGPGSDIITIGGTATLQGN